MLGAAFKPDSDDIRDSPALNVAAQIRLQGADVVVTDPAAIENARRLWPELQYATGVDEACAKADVVLVLTEWAEYKATRPGRGSASVVRQRHVLDGRNALDAAALEGGRLDLPRARPAPRLSEHRPGARRGARPVRSNGYRSFFTRQGFLMSPLLKLL